MPELVRFIRSNRRLLAFGVLLTFFSSAGQTFFVSLSAPRVIEAFDLSHAAWGAFYSAATLASACCLPFAGRWIDALSVRRFSLGAAAGLAAASTLLALASRPWILFAALFGLRFVGQGLMGLTAAAAIARAFDARRGVALSVSSLGFPLGEIVLPPAFLLLLDHVHWRTGWLSVAAAIVLVLIPLIWITAAPPFASAAPRDGAEARPEAGRVPVRSWTRREVVSHRRFYLIAPAYVSPAFLATGLILYQFDLAEQKGWPAATMAVAFVMFGVARLVSSLASGPLIDRFRAARVFPWHLLPLMLGLVAIWLSPSSWAAGLYYGLMGVSLGVGSNAGAAFFAESYGPNHLGAIKSLMATTAILSTAASPILLGWLLDLGVPFRSMFPVALSLLALFTAASAIACQGVGKESREPRPARPA